MVICNFNGFKCYGMRIISKQWLFLFQMIFTTWTKICTSFLTRPCIQAFVGWDNVFVLFHDANLAHTTFIRENMNCEWESTLLLHPLIILLFLVCPSPVMSTIINCFYLVDLQRMLFYCHIVLKMKNIKSRISILTSYSYK